MSESARITSVDAVATFLSQLRVFRENVRGILLAHEQQVRRLRETFGHDLPRAWEVRVRDGYERVAETRTAFDACRLRTMSDERPSCFEERKAHERARSELEHAQQMDDVIRQWTRTLDEAIDDARARLGKFHRILDVDVEKTCGLLLRMLSSLEGYLGRPIGEDEQSSSPAEKADPAPDSHRGAGPT